MRSTRTDDRDVAPELRKAIERTGYYPEVVHDAVASAVAGEQVVGNPLAFVAKLQPLEIEVGAD